LFHPFRAGRIRLRGGLLSGDCTVPQSLCFLEPLAKLPLQNWVVGQFEETIPQGLNRLRKNVERQANLPKKLTSGAKARVDFMLFMPGLKPRPTARTSFSAACKADFAMRISEA
jgi:hypothetical protein